MNNIFQHMITAPFFIGVFGIGFFILPFFFSKNILFSLIGAVNSFETSRRDSFFQPIVAVFVRFGIHPHAVTLGGAGFTALFAIGLFTGARPLFLFMAVVCAALSDMFDGMVARASDKITSFGGMLDGARDLFLFLVVTAGVIMRSPAEAGIITSFIVGAITIEILKGYEIVLRGFGVGFMKAAKDRLGGYGKLSFDRIKFFFYLTGCVMLIFGDMAGIGFVDVARVFFSLAIFFVIVSLLSHGVIMRFGSFGGSAEK